MAGESFTKPHLGGQHLVWGGAKCQGGAHWPRNVGVVLSSGVRGAPQIVLRPECRRRPCWRLQHPWPSAVPVLLRLTGTAPWFRDYGGKTFGESLHFINGEY